MSNPNHNVPLITPMQGLHALAEQAVFSCDENVSAQYFVLSRMAAATPADRQKLWDAAASHGIERAIITMRTVKDATVELERLRTIHANMMAGTVGAYEMKATLDLAERVLVLAQSQLERIEKEVPHEEPDAG